MTSNLPPGCNVAEIPGNTNLDEQWEKAWDDLADYDISPSELILAVKLYLEYRKVIKGDLMTCPEHGPTVLLICQECSDFDLEESNE